MKLVAACADAVIDSSAMPGYWVTNGMQVVHDSLNKRVYLTGLYSTLGVGNRPATGLTAITPYSQDFETLDKTSPTALSADGWAAASQIVMRSTTRKGKML